MSISSKKRKNTIKKKRSKSFSLIYYKMKNCEYCKIFEKQLWKKIKDYCKKKNIKTLVVVRELNPEYIPDNIKSFPSLVKINKGKSTLFNKKRTINNIKRFLN